MKVSLNELSKCKKLFGMENSREPMFNSNTWTTEYLCLNYIPTILSSLFHRTSTHGYVKLKEIKYMTYNCIQGEIRSIQCNKYNQTGVNIKETDDG